MHGEESLLIRVSSFDSDARHRFREGKKTRASPLKVTGAGGVAPPS